MGLNTHVSGTNYLIVLVPFSHVRLLSDGSGCLRTAIRYAIVCVSHRLTRAIRQRRDAAVALTEKRRFRRVCFLCTCVRAYVSCSPIFVRNGEQYQVDEIVLALKEPLIVELLLSHHAGHRPICPPPALGLYLLRACLRRVPCMC